MSPTGCCQALHSIKREYEIGRRSVQWSFKPCSLNLQISVFSSLYSKALRLCVYELSCHQNNCLRSYVCVNQWCRRRGCRGCKPKRFDLSKIWAKFLKIRAKMVPNVVWFKKWRPTFSDKHMKTLFLEFIPKKGFNDLCGRKFVGKVAHKLFGQAWEILGKNPSHPQKIAWSYTYGVNADLNTLLATQFSIVCFMSSVFIEN